MITNSELKKYMHAKHVALWRVAEELNLADYQFSRKLRHELPECDKKRVMEIVDRLAAEAAKMKEGASVL